MQRITIATRGSQLALWQAEHIKARLQTQHGPNLAVELKIITTTGDKILDAPLAKIGGKGLFLKEIEEALLAEEADLAVHSMKDVPPPHLRGLYPGRHSGARSPSDTLLLTAHGGLDSLPPGARVGTCQPTPAGPDLARRPDVQVLPLRGNVDARLRKLMEGQFDAIVMATAALNRLGLEAPRQLLDAARLSARRRPGGAGPGIQGRARGSGAGHRLPGPPRSPPALVLAERGFMEGLERRQRPSPPTRSLPATACSPWRVW